MIGTFTLATTTFASDVSLRDTQVTLTSTSGIVPGVFLFANRELFKIIAPTPVANTFAVLRGQEGTFTRFHAAGFETVYIAQGYQLYDVDPAGTPSPGASPFANPHINVQNGNIWVTVGDDTGPDSGARVWQLVTNVQTTGALGVRSLVTTTPS